MASKIVDIDGRLPVPKATVLGLQHVLSMFGGAVLVPLLTGFSPSVTIMCSGIGTILYLLSTHNKIPSYLGPSFAVIAPVSLAATMYTHGDILSGVIAIGVAIVAISLIVKFVGTRWLTWLVPPILVGTYIFVVGVGLSASAVKMAFLQDAVFSWRSLLVAAVALVIIVACDCFSKGFLSSISVICGVVASYVMAVVLGMVDFSNVVDAPWFGLPDLTTPTFSVGAIIALAPLALMLLFDHVAHLFVVGGVTGRDFTPMLDKSLRGDGLATIISGCIGGLPTTTFAENMGVMSITRVFATQVFWFAGGIAFIIGGFCPKLEALIYSIPDATLGGASIMIFGLIAVNGLRMLVRDKSDFDNPRNVAIVAPTIIVGAGMTATGAVLYVAGYPITGLIVSMFLGIILNVLIPNKKAKKENDREVADT